MVKRKELLVYFNYKQALVEEMKLNNATVEYVNKKAGYAVIYIDSDKASKFINHMKNMHGIKKIDESPTELVELNI